MMGCSNPHPHSQVWSLSTVPTLPTKELNNLRQYPTSSAATSDGPKGYRNQPCLLCEYVTYERCAKERLVLENEHFVALVPWWAYWPFEIIGTSCPFLCILKLTAPCQCYPTRGTSPPYPMLPQKRHVHSQILYPKLPSATTTSFPVPSPMPWASTSAPSLRRVSTESLWRTTMTSHTSMSTLSPRC
jgi:hypothetical protein